MMTTQRNWHGEFEQRLDVERAAFKAMQASYFKTLPHLNPASAIGAELCKAAEKATAIWREEKAKMTAFMDEFRLFG